MNFTTENKGTWFFFDESNEDAGGVCIRLCTPNKYEQIEKLTTKKKDIYKQGNRFEKVEKDEKKLSHLLWDYVIVDWKNVEIDGTELECSKENKIKLMGDNIAFTNFISNCLNDLTDHIDLDREAKEKN